MEEQNPRAIPSLPDDLKSEILLRPPARSIARFRCVSKLWLSLTTDPHFIKTHSSISPISTSCFYICCYLHKAELFHLNGNNLTSSSADPSLSFLDFRDCHAEIVHSCNGLILSRLSKKAFAKRPPFLLSFCNPTTKEHDVVPFPGDPQEFDISLAFDPSVSPHFKAVALPVYYSERKIFKCVFSSRTRLQKCLDDNNCIDVRAIDPERSAFWKGNLCWIGRDRVVCLDTEAERVNRLPIPSDAMRGISRIMEFGGRWHCIAAFDGLNFSNSHYYIYEMESMSSGWSLLYTVDVDDAILRLCLEEKGGHLPLKAIWFGHGGENGVGDHLLSTYLTRL